MCSCVKVWVTSPMDVFLCERKVLNQKKQQGKKSVMATADIRERQVDSRENCVPMCV